MRIRTGVMALAVAAGALAACTPTKLVPNAGMLRRADGELVTLVVPCRDHRVIDVILEEVSGNPPPASPKPTARWWIDAPREPTQPLEYRTVDGPIEVIPFQVLPGWTVQESELGPPMRPGVTYSVGGFMQGEYRHQAAGPDFTLADLDRLRPGEVYAEPGGGRGTPIVMSRADFEHRASDAC